MRKYISKCYYNLKVCLKFKSETLVCLLNCALLFIGFNAWRLYLLVFFILGEMPPVLAKKYGMTEIYGTVSVKSIEEKAYAFFTKRKLEVSQGGVNSE